MGKVNRIRTGLIKVFTNPKTRAASNAEKTPSSLNPGIRASAISKARLFKQSRRNKFIILYPMNSFVDPAFGLQSNFNLLFTQSQIPSQNILSFFRISHQMYFYLTVLLKNNSKAIGPV